MRRLPEDLFRMAPWGAAALLLLAAVGGMAPQQLGVVLYKLALITTAAWTGYWIDRSLFPYGRPDRIDAQLASMAALRRAIVIAACVIGVSIGL